MTVKKYNLKFTQLSKSTPTMVADSRAKMNKFFMGMSNLVVNESSSDMLIPRMDILVSWFMQNKLRSKSLSKLVGS